MINIIATRAHAVYDGDIRTIALCDIAAGRHLDDAMIGHALCDMSPGAALAELYADMMTEDDISRWWGDGGHIEDTRDLLIARGMRYSTYSRVPPDDEIRAARVRIAAAIIADYHRVKAENQRNRELSPCDGECEHSYDEWPVGSVTNRDRELDQCSSCGWTDIERGSAVAVANQRITDGIACIVNDVPPGWVHEVDRSILRWKLMAVVAAIVIVALAIVEAL